jgi:riboflavin kinase / FMN adenylyltransferase
MRVFRSVEGLPEFKNGVLTIGTFDGVHLGHQEIIKRINQDAAEINGESIILTFHPHPRLVVNPNDTSLKLLNTLEEKIVLLERFGVDNLIVAPFSIEFSKLTAREYVEDFLWKNIHPKKVVIGYDHRFGNNREGGLELFLKMGNELGFEVEEIAKQMVDDLTVSSTKVRNALQNGEVAQANNLLGYEYSLHGTVVEGHQMGRQLGYPTANIHPNNPNKLIPAMGVYAVKVKLEGQLYPAMLNIGNNPTFENRAASIEANLFDFDRDVYGMELDVIFVQRLRDELKFDSKEALITQMQEDEKVSRKLLY